MNKEKLSTAQRRARRRKSQKKQTGCFDFDFDTDVPSLDEYYNVFLSNEKINKLVFEYKNLNDKVYKDFLEKTKLDGRDIAFLFLAVGLQCVRQYLLTDFKERLGDQDAAKKTKGHNEEHSNRKHRYYNPSLEEIITNPVPFDANIGANGALKGGGKLGHRATAIGHDPILGLIIGTANITTSTLTTSTFKSYHISTNENRRDYFKSNADTLAVLDKTKEKLLNKGIDGKTIVGTSLLKEIIHLKSDINTKSSLPLPIVSAVDTKLASDLASYGLDMANIITVGKQATYAILINTIIAMIHRMLYNPEVHVNEKLYEVKTRKILSYSNVIATCSNVIYVAFTNNIKKLDIGGAIVTIYRIVTDEKFIRKVMHEFVDSEVTKKYNEQLEATNREFDKLIQELGLEVG